MKKKTFRAILITLLVLLAFFILAVWFMWRQPIEYIPPEPTPEITVPTPEPTPVIIEVSDIRIMLESEVLQTGSRFWPEVIIQPNNAADKSYHLYSDDERIIRQQGNSWIAAAIGTANLTATAANGTTATVAVRVTPPQLESLAFPSNEIVINLDDHFDTVLVQTPNNAVDGEQIKFISDNENIATVSSEGRITAVGVGTTIITASYGDVSAELQVNVIIAIRSIRVGVTRESRIFRVGEQAEYRIQVEPENASNASVSVSFSGARITNTGENTFICEEAGEVIITFTAGTGNPVDITVTVHDLEEFVNEVFRLTNLERTSAGISVLGEQSYLTEVAGLRAGEIIIRLDSDHRRPDGREWQTILNDYGVVYILAGENLAAGQLSPAEVVRAWMNSPDHRRNMLNPDFGHLGIGVRMDQTGRLYWVQLFMD